MTLLSERRGTALAALEKPRPRMPRILYLITRAERGGAQVHVLDLASGMRRHFDVVVATGEEGYLADSCRQRGIPVHVVSHLGREINPIADLRGLREIVHLLRGVKPNLVHSHTFKAGFLGRLAAGYLKIACVHTVHMWHFGSAAPLLWRLLTPVCERVAARRCDRIIAVSEQAARTAARRRIVDSPQQVISIRNGIPEHAARARLDRDGALSCTMVARFSDLKDHALLLRAFSKVPGEARLNLVGDGDTLAATINLSKELGIRERVEFTGSRGDVPEILAQTDVFVLASKAETLPISILEAMRAGLPVIASDVGGVSEEVLDGKTGLLVSPGSVEDLRHALTRLMSDKALRISMGQAGRRRFEEMFLADTMIQRTQAVYRQVLGERLYRRMNRRPNRRRRVLYEWLIFLGMFVIFAAFLLIWFHTEPPARSDFSS